MTTAMTTTRRTLAATLIGYRASGIGYRASGIGYRASVIGYRLSVIGYRLSDLLQLFQMMYVMAGELRGDPVGREVAVFRVLERTLTLRGRQVLEHRDVQPPQREIRVERGRAVRVCVRREPRVLIERLRDVAVLRHREPHAYRQPNLH